VRQHSPASVATRPRVPLPRWVAPLLGVAAVALVPWTLWLTFSLPSHHVAHLYRLAWVGFDVALAAAFGATALGVARSSAWLEIAAAVAGTLLLCDAWFDVVTANGGDERALAALEAAVGELPLAADCAWIVRDAQRFREARLLRRRPRP
jgi:hypothetical protein